MKRPIAIGLAPNLEKIDALKALSFLIQPWTYKRGCDSQLLEKWFEVTYKYRKAVSFTSARGALFAILQSLALKKGDEVLVQAFTCKAVVEPILALGLIPIYIDIQKDFILSDQDVKTKISTKTKAIILQHTFGIPNVPMSLIKQLKAKRIFVIEDLAHIIDPSQKKIGIVGDCAIFSFGRDKAFSSVMGGIAATSNKTLAKSLEEFQKIQRLPSSWWVFQNLFHSVSFYFFILPMYDVLKIGKIILVILQKLNMLSLPVEEDGLTSFEKYYQKLPSSIASLALLQLQRLEVFNNKRRDTVRYYNNVLNTKTFSGSLLRYPFFVNNPKEIKTVFRKHNIYLGDWYAHIIDPASTDLKSVKYSIGSCPIAESIANHIVNLPTYPTLSNTDREKIAMILKDYDKSKRSFE